MIKILLFLYGIGLSDIQKRSAVGQIFNPPSYDDYYYFDGESQASDPRCPEFPDVISLDWFGGEHDIEVSYKWTVVTHSYFIWSRKPEARIEKVRYLLRVDSLKCSFRKYSNYTVMKLEMVGTMFVTIKDLFGGYPKLWICNLIAYGWIVQDLGGDCKYLGYYGDNDIEFIRRFSRDIIPSSNTFQTILLTQRPDIWHGASLNMCPLLYEECKSAELAQDETSHPAGYTTAYFGSIEFIP